VEVAMNKPIKSTDLGFWIECSRCSRMTKVPWDMTPSEARVFTCKVCEERIKGGIK